MKSRTAGPWGAVFSTAPAARAHARGADTSCERSESHSALWNHQFPINRRERYLTSRDPERHEENHRRRKQQSGRKVERSSNWSLRWGSAPAAHAPGRPADVTTLSCDAVSAGGQPNDPGGSQHRDAEDARRRTSRRRRRGTEKRERVSSGRARGCKRPAVGRLLRVTPTGPASQNLPAASTVRDANFTPLAGAMNGQVQSSRERLGGCHTPAVYVPPPTSSCQRAGLVRRRPRALRSSLPSLSDDLHSPSLPPSLSSVFLSSPRSTAYLFRSACPSLACHRRRGLVFIVSAWERSKRATVSLGETG